MTKQAQRKCPPADCPPIVGIGASAGGFEALSELLRELGNERRLAIVFVQHLQPDVKTLMVDWLEAITELPVKLLKARTRIEPGTIFIGPPRSVVGFEYGQLVVEHVPSDSTPPSVINCFFSALAEAQAERAAGVVLSGAGSDGMLGLKAISDAGGLTFAQDSNSARFDSMPRNAAIAGGADFVLPPAGIATELIRFAEYQQHVAPHSRVSKHQDRIEAAIPLISAELLKVTDHNFIHYKTSTLSHRISRRMQVLKLARVEDYVQLVERDTAEVQQLFRESRIGVTGFFRDPDAFEALACKIIPKLFEKRARDDTVRIWCAGCATGEEAYTLAILCREYLQRVLYADSGVPADEAEDSLPITAGVQIVASDIDEQALTIARTGSYPSGIADHVPAELLDRYFARRGKRFVINPDVRDMVLFSSHDLISDPPFSRQDLITCRNLLIYLGPHLQKKLITRFHHALRPDGYLYLGPSESNCSHGELFRCVDEKYHISQRKGTAVNRTVPLSMMQHTAAALRPPPATADDENRSDIVQIMQRLVLNDCAPRSVVVDDQGQIVCSSTNMSRYLSTGEGAFANNIIKMARRGLRIGLRASLATAKKRARRVTHENLSVLTDQGKQRVMITVQPIMPLGQDNGLFMVVFHEVGLPMTLDSEPNVHLGDVARSCLDRQADALIEQLERELETRRDDLEKSMQEMEAAHEESNPPNELLLSMDEELQSANEGLETSKEENGAGSVALMRANSGLENLLQSSQIATIFLDEALCIRSFTPAVADIYDLIATDIGRPLSMFVPKVRHMPPLQVPVADGRTDSSIEDKIQPSAKRSSGDIIDAGNGLYYVRRLSTCVTADGQRDGFVVTFADVTALRTNQKRLSQALHAGQMNVIELALSGDGLVFEGALHERLGLHPGMLPEAYVQRIHPEDCEAFLSACHSCTPKQPCYSHTYRYSAHEGEYLWLHENAEVSFDALGRAVRLTGIVRDVTLEQQKTLKLERWEQRLSLAMQASGMASFEWLIESGVSNWDPPMHELLGLPANAEASASTFMARVHAEDLPELNATLERALQSGEDYAAEFRIVRPDGQTRWLAGRGRILPATDSEPRRMLGLYRDITATRELQGHLEFRTRQLQTVTDALPQLVAYVDAQLCYRFANKAYASRFGQGVDEIIGQHVHEVVGVENYTAMGPQLRKALAGERCQYDLRLKIPGTSQVRITEVTYVPEVDANGAVAGCHVLAMDVTDRQQQAERISHNEQMLQQAQQRLNLALSAGQMGSFDWLVNANKLFWSDQLYDLYGCDPATFTPTPEAFWHLIHPDDRDGMREHTRQQFERGDTEHRAEFRIVRPCDGRTIWVQGSGRICRDQAGSVEAINGVVSDITRRKSGELALADREAHLRRVIDNTIGFIGVLDPDGVLLEVNQKALAAAGIGREEVIGQAFWECYWWSHDDTVASRLKQAVAQAAAGDTARYDERVRMAGDSLMMIDFMLAPIRDEAGRITHLIPSGFDISDRVRSEQRLLAAERFSRSVLESSPDCVKLIDAEGRIDKMNATGLGLMEIDDFAAVRGQPWGRLWPEEVRPLVQQSLQDAKAKGEGRFQAFCPTAKGTPKWWDVIVTPIRDTDTVNRFVSVSRDISERKRVEENLQASREQLQLGLQVAGAGIGRIDYASGRVELSAQAAMLYGLGDSAIEVSRAELHATFHENDRRELDSAIQDCLEGPDGGPLVAQHRIMLPDGNVRWLDVRKQFVWDETAEPARVLYSILAARDVTADRLRQEAFRFRSELADKLVAIDDVQSIQRTALYEIAAHFSASRAHLAYFDIGKKTAQVLEEYRPEHLPSIIGRHDLHTFLTPHDIQRLQNLEPMVFDDVMTEKRSAAQRAAFEAIGIRSLAHHQYSIGADICEAVAVARDHPYHWREDELELLRDLGMLVFARVQRAHAEQSLAETAKRLRVAMMAAQMGTFSWHRKTDETMWDEQWCEMAGLPHDVERSGKAFFKMVHPDDLAELHAITERSHRDAMPYRCEFRMVAADGQVRWVAGRGEWVDDESGERNWLVGLNWNITELKQAQLEATTNEQRLRLAAESAGFGTYQVDIDARRVVWSDEFRKLVGLTADDTSDPEHGSVPSFVHPEDRDAVRQHLEEVLADLENADHTLVHRIVRPDGEVRHVRLQSRSLFEGRGTRKRLRMLIGTLLDVTRQHEYEQQLKLARRQAEAANASKSAFLANMSHEIRTPMTAILGYADLVRELVEHPEAREHLQTIRRNGDYLLEIINDILDLSKIEAGKLDVDAAPFEPMRVIEDVRSIMEVRARQSELELIVEYDGPLPRRIQSDAKRLKQILINLVGNAIKFTREGQVRVCTRYEQASGNLCIDVIDTGIGMSQTQQTRLFKPFTQGDSGVSREFGGTGLGLAISQRLAEVLGGSISVESAPDQGSRLRLIIAIGPLPDTELTDQAKPAQCDEPPECEWQARRSEPHDAPAPSISLSCRVLVVDDRRDVRLLSKMLLTRAGAMVDEAADGQLAVDHIVECLRRDDCPDLILLDMQMPNLDGYETARQLRRLGYTGPIVALTADAMQGDMTACIEAGCNDYLSKPIDAAVLIGRVRELTQ